MQVDKNNVNITQQEMKCMELVAQGKSSWVCSQILGLSEHTVTFHIKNVMAKLGVNSRTTAAIELVKAGIIPYESKIQFN